MRYLPGKALFQVGATYFSYIYLFILLFPFPGFFFFNNHCEYHVGDMPVEGEDADEAGTNYTQI